MSLIRQMATFPASIAYASIGCAAPASAIGPSLPPSVPNLSRGGFSYSLVFWDVVCAACCTPRLREDAELKEISESSFAVMCAANLDISARRARALQRINIGCVRVHADWLVGAILARVATTWQALQW